MRTNTLVLEERDWLYALIGIKGIGRRTIYKMYQSLGSFSALEQECLRETRTQKWQISAACMSHMQEEMRTERVSMRKLERIKQQISFVCFLDDYFPSILREIPDPPALLFYQGDISLVETWKIGVVGSRNPSTYGKSACQFFVKDLSKAGFTIVSGLARGIDAEAHQTALTHHGKTIAVLGCGIDVIYPVQNRTLYQAIATNGLLLSEYPPGTEPHPGFFPERNRLISGLCMGVLVMEAAERSGSLITADFAIEQGRDVFAVPGSIFSKASVGTHHLIKQGAKLVTNVADILEEYTHLTTAITYERPPVQLNLNETNILLLLDFVPIHWDELYTKLDEAQKPFLDRDLLQLEAKGMVTSLPGGYYLKQRDA